MRGARRTSGFSGLVCVTPGTTDPGAVTASIPATRPGVGLLGAGGEARLADAAGWAGCTAGAGAATGSAISLALSGPTLIASRGLGPISRHESAAALART